MHKPRIKYQIDQNLIKTKKTRFTLPKRLSGGRTKSDKFLFVDRFFPKEKKKQLKKHKYPKLIELVKWLIIDYYRFLRYPHRIEFSNFYIIVGRRGEGKTITLSKILSDLREKHGKNIMIGTNYYFAGQDFQISHWKQMLIDYPKPVVFGIDEIQQEFDSRDWANFPAELFYEMSQSRKKGKMMISTAQFYNMVDKRIREYSDYVIKCMRVIGLKRWIRYTTYDRLDYEIKLKSDTSQSQKKIPKIDDKNYIASDTYREMYDTKLVVQRSREKKYIPARETDIVNYGIKNSP